MADEVFKLPQSSYETVCKIVIAYTHVAQKTNLAEVSKILGNDTTVISRNIGFLLGVGLLEGGRDKQITPDGARLGRALEFQQTDEISRGWREALSTASLIQRILSAIRVRGGMDGNTLQTQIVYTAGVSKTSGTTVGAAAVIEMLKASGLIIERDGKITAPAVPDLPDESGDVPSTPALHVAPPTAGQFVESAGQRITGTGTGPVSVHVELQIRVEATHDDLELVGRNLRAMLNELREGEADVSVNLDAPLPGQ